MSTQRAPDEDVTVAAVELRGLITDLKTHGVLACDIEACLRDHVDVVRDADVRIGGDAYVRLLQLGAERSGDPAYALHYGARCRPAEGGIVYSLASTSATHLQGFQIAIRYARLLGDVTRAELDIASERAVFRVWVPDPRFRHPDVIEAALGRTAATLAELWRDRLVVHEVRMSALEPDQVRRAAHREVFRHAVALARTTTPSCSIDPSCSWSSRIISPTSTRFWCATRRSSSTGSGLRRAYLSRFAAPLQIFCRVQKRTCVGSRRLSG